MITVILAVMCVILTVVLWKDIKYMCDHML